MHFKAQNVPLKKDGTVISNSVYLTRCGNPPIIVKGANRGIFYLFGDVAFSKYFLYQFRFLFVWRTRRTVFPSEGYFSTL